MLNNFIYSKTKALFLKALNNNEVLDESIVFIEDTKEIWNHGTYFCGNSVDISNIEESINSILNTKLDTITDLETIRQGAAKGATAVQPSLLANVATSGSYNDLTNKPTIPAIVTESTVSDWGFIKNVGYTQVNHGTSNTTFTLTSNTFHIWDEVAELTLTFEEETTGVANEFLFQFTSGSTATTLTLPNNIKWTNHPYIQPNKIYQISILNNLGTILEFDV